METELQRKERERQEDLQRLRGLRPIDDDFMRCLFRDNIPLTQQVLRILTGKGNLTITSVETQADIKRLVGARSICLDAYGTDDEGKKYDMEVQRSDRGAGKHRARYHSSAMDIDNLDAGQDFSELPDTYTIFITENDIFAKGLPCYAIERMNMATGELFNDGEHILYINGAYRGDDEIGKLMHDFSCSDPDDMINKELADRTRYFKETEEGVEAVCKVMEDMRTEKARETRIDDIQKMMIKLKMTVDQAMDVLDIPASERSIYMDKICAK
ncbi:PD-(D/E)XK nuclease family transposase [Oribacterium sp. P6A1]|uniref:PD-(D/E)XK nuclease family transposase n=1 Tax=Oribacterium sp. P6A1 TaxID=1410612 RepID=UPI00055D3598|nr:PD-(D/E)XK nuclease family transposase [Oribacterium sp. P6A1]